MATGLVVAGIFGSMAGIFNTRFLFGSRPITGVVLLVPLGAIGSVMDASTTLGAVAFCGASVASTWLSCVWPGLITSVDVIGSVRIGSPARIHDGFLISEERFFLL